MKDFPAEESIMPMADDLREEQIWDQDGQLKTDTLICSCMIFPQIMCLVFFRPFEGQIFDDNKSKKPT